MHEFTTWLFEAGWTQTVLILGVSLTMIAIVYLTFLAIMQRVAPTAEVHITPAGIAMCSTAIVIVLARHPEVVYGVVAVFGVLVAIGVSDWIRRHIKAAERRNRRRVRHSNRPLRP